VTIFTVCNALGDAWFFETKSAALKLLKTQRARGFNPTDAFSFDVKLTPNGVVEALDGQFRARMTKLKVR
jgi:hypothetical protein